jgi:hypothetical protein
VAQALPALLGDARWLPIVPLGWSVSALASMTAASALTVEPSTPLLMGSTRPALITIA